MATNTVLSTGDYSSPTIAIGASAVDSVTFGDDCDRVEVLNLDPAAVLYFTVDSSTPTAGTAKNTYCVPAGGALVVSVPTSGLTVVKLFSTGTPKYVVTRAG